MDLMRRRIGFVLLASILMLGWLAACTPAPSTATLPTAVPTTDTALTWQREGGLAGFCDEVSVAVTGEVAVSSCRGEQPVSFRLDVDQMAKLTAWQRSFQSFQYAWRDPAQADGMTIEVNFTGTGAQAAMEPDQALIADFAQNLYNEGNMAASAASAVCATPPAGQQVLVETAQGYCLHYPADYSLIQSNPDGMEIVVDTVMNHSDPRASLTVEAANGRSLAAVVAQMIADFVQPGQAVDRHDLTIDGVPAVMLDNLLGQDVYRRVVLIQNERLYSFFFSPIGEAGTATRQQAEALYQTVIDSLRFLETTTAANPDANTSATPEPLPIPAAADVISSEVQYIQALVNVNIRSGPGTNYGIVGNIAAGQVALVTGAMPDGSWWRVICPDDSVGNCFVVNDPSLTQPTTPPGGNAPINETGEAIVEDLEVRLLESFPVQVEAVVRGQLPDACTTIQGAEVVSAGPTFRVRLTTARQADRQCAQVLTPFEQVVALNVAGLPAGDYDVRINDLVAPFTLQVDNGAAGSDPTGTTATYQDDEAGFAFDYHAPAWTMGEKLQIGSRSYVVQMTFSTHAPEETGDTYLEAAVMTWDPKDDLAAYIAVRKQAWAASGMPIVDEEARTLAGGHPAMRFLVNGADGTSQGFFLITTVGDQYLVLSGAGNVAALEEVGQTLRVQTP